MEVKTITGELISSSLVAKLTPVIEKAKSLIPTYPQEREVLVYYSALLNDGRTVEISTRQGDLLNDYLQANQSGLEQI